MTASPNTSPGSRDTAPGRPARRVSLACLPCRTRHMKCDATKPCCSRCLADGVTCVYAQSRRRGGHRQAVTSKVAPVSQQIPEMDYPEQSQHRALPTPTSSGDLTVATEAKDRDTNMSRISGLESWSSENLQSPSCSGDINYDLVKLYYSNFHNAHPCALPRWSLLKHYSSNPSDFTPILLVMQYIGSIYDPSADSECYKDVAAASLRPIDCLSTPRTPHQVQAMLLYSIAIHWCDEIEKGAELMSEVIATALKLRMHDKSFTLQYGGGDAVLEESWRRTWWQIYVTEGHIAGSTHSYPTRISRAEPPSTLLPCEDEQYESGEIPRPRTLEEYDMREFLPEDDVGFSSFAQVVGLTRTLDLLLARHTSKVVDFAALCSQIDISLSAWCSLLPRSKHFVLNSKGEVDPHLFQANMGINTYIVDLHRRLSDLSYSSVEAVARCSPPAPPTNGGETSPEDRHLHTGKALLAIRRLGDLLPLPPNIVTHTPFIICMIANTLVAHLSACRFLFRGRTLQLERERIRSKMGALRMLGECWPLGKRTYREMGIIAREILCLSDEDIPRQQPRQTPVHNTASRQVEKSRGRSSTELVQDVGEGIAQLDGMSSSISNFGVSVGLGPSFADFENISQSMLDEYGNFPFNSVEDFSSVDAM